MIALEIGLAVLACTAVFAMGKRFHRKWLKPITGDGDPNL